jgi:uncharacterized membrane protein (UPF0127 family)
MRKWSIFAGGITLLMVLGCGIWLWLTAVVREDVLTVWFGERAFRVEVADTSTERSLGLGGRKELCAECGMLFVFEQADRHGFWMKDMRFPLDILWIKGNEVVFVAENVPMEPLKTLRPPVEADKVLEINAGLAKQYGIHPGSRMKILE